MPDEDIPPHDRYVLDVLLNCVSGSSIPKERAAAPTPVGVQPCPPGQKGEPLVVPVLLSTVEHISHMRVHLPKDMRPLPARETVWNSILEVQRRFPDGITLLDPIKNMKITDDKFKSLVEVSHK